MDKRQVVDRMLLRRRRRRNRMSVRTMILGRWHVILASVVSGSMRDI